MRAKVISPYRDGEQIWIGLDTDGMRRKVFRFVHPGMGSEEFMAGVTVFEPGESSSVHIHPVSEEINLVLSGSGVFHCDEEEHEFGPGAMIWIPKNVYHQHSSTGTEPLQLLWIYTPQAELPST